MKSYNVRDAEHIKSNAMPAAASTTVNGSAIDLGGALSANGARLAACELLLTMPALTTTMAPDTKTMAYTIEAADDTAFTSPTTLYTVTKTGAGGAGVAADTFRLKVPSDCKRYIRAKAVSGAGTADASAVAMKLELLF